MRRRLAAAVSVLATAACAHGPPAPEHRFEFPASFDANQIVTVRSGTEERELVASLRRRGDDYQVTLFDPIFSIPLLSASSRNGTVTVERQQESGADVAALLLSLLKDLYGRTFRANGPDRLEARSAAFAFALTGVHPRGGCLFPERIEVAPRRGSAIHVLVVTIDLSCEVPGTIGQ